MLTFWIYIVFLFLFFSMSDSEPYPDDRCSKNDCSYQLQDFMSNTCKIYNTSVCLDSYKLEESSEETLTSEEESKFHFSIVPYTAELVVKEDFVVTTATRSAINITLTINNTGIDKLVVKIYNKTSATICRIFDFHIGNNTKLPISLFYDCLYNLAENGSWQNVRMDFIALPLKEKLSYNVFIPGTYYAGSYKWQPLIMVFRGNLHNGVVQVKFSQAPELFNVSSYIIKLSSLSGDEKTIEIAPDISRRMLCTQFSSVDGGSYWVSVKPVIQGMHGNWTKTDKFEIEMPKSYQMLTVYLCVFILLIFSAFVFLKMFCRNIAKSRFGSKPRILLLYSPYCDEHIALAIAFVQYLIQHCHVEVSSIYDDLPKDWNPYEEPMKAIPNVKECDPLKWIKKKYNECDIFMYLISAGLFHTLDSQHPLPIQIKHEWRKQLKWATNIILSELLNCTEDIRKKRICKVSFQNPSKKHIPDCLRTGFGKCYDLPEEMKNLINFMHVSGECFLCNDLCIADFELPFDGTNLCEKLRDMQAAVDKKTDIRIIPSLRDTTNDSKNNLENPDEISTTSISSNGNSDIFVNFTSESWPESFSKERLENMSLSGSPDNICPMVELEGDSDSEEGVLLPHQPNLHNEFQTELVIESFLNKN